MFEKNSVMSFTKIIEESVRKTFEKVMFDEIDRIHAQSAARLDEFTNIQKAQAKRIANEMTLELMHKMGSAGISIELKI